ncbi:MAG: glutamate racemase, partial [Candidatus Omnitrophica bacterium]|nr:glutamate racemase [Candidatus Omnitrophota bacterium]
MKSIGVFDSGVGGLTVARELIRHLPNEDIVYFGDIARVPYGIKSRETVIRFSIENILFLLKHNVKLICVACNTVSSFALPVIKHHFR